MITTALDGAIKKFLETIENDYQDWSMEAANRPSWSATKGSNWIILFNFFGKGRQTYKRDLIKMKNL